MRVLLRIGGPWWIRWGLLSMLVAGIGCAIAFATTASDCDTVRSSSAESRVPNPLRAVVSEELLEWKSVLEDGGFEAGTAELVELPHPVARLEEAAVGRSADAARSGGWGLRISAGPRDGALLGIRAEIEKGEQTRCSFWARSGVGPIDVRVSVLGMERASDKDPIVLHEPDEAFAIGEGWTYVEFVFSTTNAVAFALLALDVGPNVRLDIDDVAIDVEQWSPAPVTRCSRTVGGITVPLEAVAPFHFNVLIHIEDPRLITQNESFFREKTAVFSELARILFEHGGFLTIQTEEDWPMAALRFAPITLSDLAMNYGVVYSTHTHGPKCTDPDGRLRSSQDCNDCRTCAGWTQIETDTDPYTPQYVGALRDLISDASSAPVSDHNGNFRYEHASSLHTAGLSTWSAFKNQNTQATFDELYTNPWRPTACDAVDSPRTFQTHDPTTQIIFIPGWGQAITRHPERLQERLAAMLSQVLRFADPARINTFYIVTHVDHYQSETGEPYIDWDETTGELVYGDEFLRDLGYWENTLTQLIDPLVEEGYLRWTSLPDIGDLFVDWERTV